jgi:two-component system C4-dicarboxylate transport response regulator DctD
MNNPSALIVEDDKDVAELYGRVLASLGFAIEITQTGEAALARLAVAVPNVVLLDLHLPPHVSGADILHHIRADQRLAETRVVVVTGHPDLAETVKDEADLVLLKPVDVGELSDQVARLHRSRRGD